MYVLYLCVVCVWCVSGLCVFLNVCDCGVCVCG